MSDCLWGLLDGINEDGLAVSLTFGGRRDVGDGFAIPLVVRHVGPGGEAEFRFGTIYTAAYHPAEGRAEYGWPGSAWEPSTASRRRSTW